MEYGHSDAIPGEGGKPKRPQDRRFEILKKTPRQTKVTLVDKSDTSFPHRLCMMSHERGEEEHARFIGPLLPDSELDGIFGRCNGEATSTHTTCTMHV